MDELTKEATPEIKTNEFEEFMAQSKEVENDKLMLITKKLLGISEEYKEINPNLGMIFNDLIITYFDIVNDLIINDKADYNSFQVRTKLFERIFDYNFEEEFKILINDYFANNENVINGSNDSCGTDGQNNDKDINNVDKDVLANIKKNIQTYLD